MGHFVMIYRLGSGDGGRRERRGGRTPSTTGLSTKATSYIRQCFVEQKNWGQDGLTGQTEMPLMFSRENWQISPPSPSLRFMHVSRGAAAAAGRTLDGQSDGGGGRMGMRSPSSFLPSPPAPISRVETASSLPSLSPPSFLQLFHLPIPKRNTEGGEGILLL